MSLEAIKIQKFEKVERIADWHELLRDFLKRTPIEIKPTVTPLMPKRISWDDVRRHGPFMNIWDLEPLFLDTLELVKEQQKATDILITRGLIRSTSWSSHKPIYPEVAKADAGNFLSEAQENEQQIKLNPFTKQTGFGFEEEAESASWQHVMDEVGTMDCKGDQIESATNFVEKVFVKEWKAFLALYHEKGIKRTWPDRGIEVKLEPEITKATERIVKLRGIRDQLYYQRLYPKLCEFGHQGIVKTKKPLR
ncbi:MAG: hypothetical protein WCK01_02100 [Candidatus Uhrbacteria bacterium]